MMDDVRAAVESAEPLELMSMTSALRAVVDPRGTNPFDPSSAPTMSPAELSDSLVEVNIPETTALLAVIAAFVADEVQSAKLRREIRTRAHPLPKWLARMGEARVFSAIEMSDPLGDGDNHLLGVRLATGEQFTAVVYIDHNVGTLVKDAFVVPAAVTEVRRMLSEVAQQPMGEPKDAVFADLDLADARARITDAIHVASITVPPFESDTWPACRA